MTRTNPWHLVGLAVAIAVGVAILAWGFYGNFNAVPWAVSITLWIMAAVNVLCAQKVKKSMEDGKIGLDRSQLDPLTVALFVALAKASAWTGAVIGGIYLGLALHVIPRAGVLDAAAQDLPGVITSVLGAIALSACALYLERHCETPPPPEGELAG